MRHVSASVDEDADLPADLVRELGQLAGELVGDEAVGGEAAPVEALERANLARLEALGVAEDADRSRSPRMRTLAHVGLQDANHPRGGI